MSLEFGVWGLGFGVWGLCAEWSGKRRILIWGVSFGLRVSGSSFEG